MNIAIVKKKDTETTQNLPKFSKKGGGNYIPSNISYFRVLVGVSLERKRLELLYILAKRIFRDPQVDSLFLCYCIFPKIFSIPFFLEKNSALSLLLNTMNALRDRDEWLSIIDR